MKHAHIIGAGLAGLAAALSLADAGRRVTLYEAAPAAGGRCRSYEDRELGCRIDNGNHLLLSGNKATFAYLNQLGTADTLAGPDTPLFPFMDLGAGTRWTLRPNMGRLPWWIFSPGRRVPGSKAADYLSLLALRRAGADATVANTLKPGALYTRLLEPLAVAGLNTPAATGSARLLQAIVQESLALGGAACLPRFPRIGLSESFIDPAIARLRVQRADIHTGRRIAGLQTEAGRVTALLAPDGPVALEPQDEVVLAVPAPVAAAMLPQIAAPTEFEAIVNLHYRAEATPGPAGFIGLVGSTAEWIFAKPGIVSVTISAANRLLDRAPEQLAAEVWAEITRALGPAALPDAPQLAPAQRAAAMPPWRVVREKRATFAATPAQDRRRPPARTALANLTLAGDWTATGLPATIEGAIRSGRAAADVYVRA